MLCKHSKHGCKYMFFQFSVLELLHRKYGLPEPLNLVHNSFSCPHQDGTLTGTPLLSAHFQFRPQKCRKPVKIQKIRYKSVITKKSVIFEKSKIDFKSTGCVPVSLTPLGLQVHVQFRHYMLSKFRNWYFTSQKRLLPVFSYIIRYIEVRIDLTIYFPTYLCVVISLEHYPCITSCDFLHYYAFKLNGVVYTVQKCMLRYSTYIS